MSESTSNAARSPATAEISIQLRGRPMTPGVLKDIAAILKHVEELERIRQTCCPRCHQRALREAGFEPYEGE